MNDNYQEPPKLFYIIDHDKFDLLGQYKYHGHSIINPPFLMWSNYGYEDLMNVETLRLKIKEVNGTYTDRTISICLGAYKEIAKDFLEDNAQQVHLATTMLVWKELQGKDKTIGSLPFDMIHKIIDNIF